MQGQKDEKVQSKRRIARYRNDVSCVPSPIDMNSMWLRSGLSGDGVLQELSATKGELP